MHAVETSPGHVEIMCDISGRPHTRTNEYGMFCDAPECECEKLSIAAKPGFDNFIKAAAGMCERNEPLDVDVLFKAMFGENK